MLTTGSAMKSFGEIQAVALKETVFTNNYIILRSTYRDRKSKQSQPKTAATLIINKYIYI